MNQYWNEYYTLLALSEHYVDYGSIRLNNKYELDCYFVDLYDNCYGIDITPYNKLSKEELERYYKIANLFDIQEIFITYNTQSSDDLDVLTNVPYKDFNFYRLSNHKLQYMLTHKIIVKNYL